ncbi:hypothetical protein U1Q18_012075 [Sarracenia purpurea var. burkii]
MSLQGTDSQVLQLTVAEPVKMETQASQSSIIIPEHLLCKNRLQEYTQRTGIPLPVYQTINEGVQHAPRFRSTVFVDGVYFTSPNTYANRKAAEQDVATIALAGVSQKIKEDGYRLIREDTVFCKSIINEYAVKMNLEKPTYHTVQSGALLPVFRSSLVFNGVTYSGEPGRNKKEAEQLAARAVILSILDNSDSGTVIPEIIKSKVKLYVALHKVKDLQNPQNEITPSAVNAGTNPCLPPSNGKEVIEVIGGTNYVPTPTSEACSGQHTHIPATHQPYHEFKKPKWEISPEAIAPIVFVPQQSLGVGPNIARKKNKKNKKKSTKKVQVDAQFPSDVVHVVPLNQLPPCSVAQ